MNAIAISLYDKFDDLGVLIDIIRYNWDEDYYISVCSNHPDAYEMVSDLNDEIDNFEQGSQIRYDDLSPGPRTGNNLSFRIYDSIRTSCRHAFAEDDIEYVMHLHADAWPLDELEFKNLVQDMEDKEHAVAFPSNTHVFMEKYPPGSFEDNFLIFDASEATAVNLFEYSPLELPPTWIHRILPFLCIPKFGWGKIHHYTNGAVRQHWDGTPSTEIGNDARPMYHDPELGQIHIAREDFPSGLGKSLQAHYLQEYGITEGDCIDQLLDENQMSTADLFRQLDEYIERLNNELKWYHLSVDSFGRDIRKVKVFLEEKSLSEKVHKAIGKNIKNLFFQPAISGASKSITQLATEGVRSTPESYNKYPNKSVNDMFNQELKKEDFPKELQDDYQSVFRE